MLRNYLKIAWKVLLRRKFFTFVSLFGISFTLLVLLIVSAFVDQMFKPFRPGSKLDRCLFANQIKLKGENTEVWSYPSYYFLDRYVRAMRTPEAVSIYTSASDVITYIGNRKLTLRLKYTDAAFWDMVGFTFLEGRPFDSGMVENADYVAVIDDRTRRELFGAGSALGEHVETGSGVYRVIGVIPREEIANAMINAGIYAPITTSQSAMTRTSLFTNCSAFILAADKSGFDAVRVEHQQRLDQAHRDYEGEWDTIECPLQTSSHLIANQAWGGANETDPSLMLAGIIGLMVLFMLFPAINLVNMNVSRIIERSSEIGVRKAFGASSWTLVVQFLVENLVLTLIGGIVAVVMAAVALEIITDSGMLPFGTLRLNLSILFYGLLLCFVFGIVSGVLPAYKMSRLHPVEALKGADV
ncbi:MAG: ABC transporter permease [Candidatus Zixiibacteriota bacterium]|nr:MAG: ABC transporter permease [candidate division Zixibacteria bacterium]